MRRSRIPSIRRHETIERLIELAETPEERQTLGILTVALAMVEAGDHEQALPLLERILGEHPPPPVRIIDHRKATP
mgnify:CR=1 FL=1